MTGTFILATDQALRSTGETLASRLRRLGGRDTFDDMERFVRAGMDEGVTQGVVRSAARPNSCPNRPEPGGVRLHPVAAVVSHPVPAMVPVPHQATMAAMTKHAAHSDLGSDRRRIDCGDDAGGGRGGHRRDGAQDCQDGGVEQRFPYRRPLKRVAGATSRLSSIEARERRSFEYRSAGSIDLRILCSSENSSQ